MANIEYASVVKIDGVETPVPCAFDPEYSDYDSDSSGRSETFVLTRDIVRTNLRSVAFTWRVQTPVIRLLLQMIQPEQITVRYFDLYQDAKTQYSEFTAYASATRSPKLLQWDPVDPENSWWELQISFVEY